ncbi:cupredoxin domain-containing protein [Blastococcus sp. LR1]|uniref:cupredoxin domain-containing protein n=1 Tax=Blastococcus sp. LR1 TaxID=2877000 RepID=UPI001CC9B9BC|nr:cupredoxin domain-containing protein [Blastococcus sp. LR1]MCA0143833.1 cupredoxin domain-containing protein [Blastococcus sp. LR1]
MALSACGGGGEDRSGGAPSGEAAAGTVTTAPDGTQEIAVLVRDDYDFYPAAFTVTTGRVRLSLISEAKQLTHNFRFTPDAGPAEIVEEIPIVAPGDRDTIEFAVDQPGDHQYECSFHVALGQIGMMTVVPA